MSAATEPPRLLTRLESVVVGVPDPDATGRFLRDGLEFELETAGNEIVALCAGDYGSGRLQPALRMCTRPALELVELRFELAATIDTGAVADKVRGAGVLEVNEDQDGTLRLRDPNGIPVALGRFPAPKTDSLPPSGLRPRRLGHANLKVPDPLASIEFWVSALGLWLSEQIGEDLAFLRYGAEHHNLGLRVAGETTLHHIGFEVPGWDAYRPLLDQLAAAGYRVEFGPGRHAVGRNLFTYLIDPSSGLRVELFSDMARVEHQDDPAVAPIRWRAEDRMSRTLNTWGSAPPPQSFLD